MSDATELAAAFAEITNEDPVTVTDQRGYTFTARKSYGLNQGRDMQEAGYLTEQEIELFVPAANLPTQRPSQRERFTVSAQVYQITEIETGAGAVLIRGRWMNETAALAFVYMDDSPELHQDGTRAIPMH